MAKELPDRPNLFSTVSWDSLNLLAVEGRGSGVYYQDNQNNFYWESHRKPELFQVAREEVPLNSTKGVSASVIVRYFDARPALLVPYFQPCLGDFLFKLGDLPSIISKFKEYRVILAVPSRYLPLVSKYSGVSEIWSFDYTQRSLKSLESVQRVLNFIISTRCVKQVITRRLYSRWEKELFSPAPCKLSGGFGKYSPVETSLEYIFLHVRGLGYHSEVNNYPHFPVLALSLLEKSGMQLVIHDANSILSLEGFPKSNLLLFQEEAAQMDLKVWLGLIQNAKLFIGTDSGFTSVAQGFGTPFLQIVCDSTEKKKYYRREALPGCKSWYVSGATMDSIQPAEVLSVLETALLGK